MSSHDSPSGKTILHGHGVGSMSTDEIEERAREIAVIQGRSAHDISEDDRRRAADELAGLYLPDTTLEDADGVGSLNRDPSDPVSISGTHTPNIEDPDEQQTVERLAIEGVEEAQREQMLASRRKSKA